MKELKQNLHKKVLYFPDKNNIVYLTAQGNVLTAVHSITTALRLILDVSGTLTGFWNFDRFMGLGLGLELPETGPNLIPGNWSQKPAKVPDTSKICLSAVVKILTAVGLSSDSRGINLTAVKTSMLFFFFAKNRIL